MPTLSRRPGRRGVRMPGTEVPRGAPRELPAERPSTRPRPESRPRTTPSRPDGVGPVVDCAVYVDGRREPPVEPHDALRTAVDKGGFVWLGLYAPTEGELGEIAQHYGDRKSTRLNSSHANISYAVFCLKKKNPTAPIFVGSPTYPRGSCFRPSHPTFVSSSHATTSDRFSVLCSSSWLCPSIHHPCTPPC